MLVKDIVKLLRERIIKQKSSPIKHPRRFSSHRKPKKIPKLERALSLILPKNKWIINLGFLECYFKIVS